MDKLFPIANGLVALGACIVYGFSGDIRRAVYWGAVVIITVTITF